MILKTMRQDGSSQFRLFDGSFDGYFEENGMCHQVSLESLNSTFYSVPPPGSGAILAYILNMLDLYQLQPEDDNPLLFHRIVETFKWAA